MKTYLPQPELLTRESQRLPRRTVIFAAFIFVLYFLSYYLPQFSPFGTPHTLFDRLALSSIFAISLSYLRFRRAKQSLKNLAVQIDEEKITIIRRGTVSLKFSQVKRMIEKKENVLSGGGLFLFPHPGVGRFFMGGILVPGFIDGYEEIKTIVIEKVLPPEFTKTREFPPQ